MFESETQVAWQAMAHRAPVVDAAGEEIATAEAVLGDEAEDIFHGIVARRKHDGATVEIPAARVKRMTTGHVITDLAPDEAQALAPYSGG